jgi:hypothetical protein
MTMWPRIVHLALHAAFFAAAIPAVVFALFWAGWSIAMPDYSTAKSILVFAAAASILLHFACTALFILRSAGATHRSESCILFLGLALIVLGSAWLVWGIHLGLVSADWEYYGIAAALATAGQGGVSVLILHQRTRLTV